MLVDAGPQALAVARRNAKALGLANVAFRQGDWFAPLPRPDAARWRFHLIVSNPPYVATTAQLSRSVTDWEPSDALFSGPDGLSDLRTLIAGAPLWLCDHGVLVCELSPEQGSTVLDLARERFEEAELAPDLTGRDRTLVARRPHRRPLRNLQQQFHPDH